jgi:hypothetical protein
MLLFLKNGILFDYEVLLKVDRLEKQKEQSNVKTLSSMPELMTKDPKSPVAALANMATELLRGDDSGKVSWKQSYDKITELDQQMKHMKRVETHNRVFDQVLSERVSHTFASNDVSLGQDEDQPLHFVQVSCVTFVRTFTSIIVLFLSAL